MGRKILPIAAMSTVRLIGAAILIAGSLAACNTADSSSPADAGTSEQADDDSETITDREPAVIGAMPTLNGPYAVYGEMIIRAIEFAADEANENGGVDGHAVELVTIETDGTAEDALRASERAVNREGARFLTGFITTVQYLSVNPTLNELDALLINSSARANELTGDACAPMFFQATQRNGMFLNAAASVIEDADVEDWATIAVDDAGGHDPAEAFAEHVSEAGGEIVAEAFAPRGTSDFGPYITQIAESGADGLFVVLYGGDAVSFFTQASQFGLFDQLDTAVGMDAVTEIQFEAIGEAAAGTLGTVGYYRSIDTPQNRKFVEAWTARHGSAPNYLEALVYLGMQTLFAGIDEADSVEPAEVAKALEGLEFDSILGTLTMRPEDHQLLLPSYVGEIVSSDGAGYEWDILAEEAADATTPAPNPECDMGG